MATFSINIRFRIHKVTHPENTDTLTRVLMWSSIQRRITSISVRLNTSLSCAAGAFHSHFSKFQFTPNGGEKMHLTFAQDDFGPDPAPLMAEVARRGWSPTFICESAGTQAEDALTMKKLYQACQK